MRHVFAILALAGALTVSRQTLSAHDGLREQIAAISTQIAASPDNVELIVRRAALHRAARHWKEALADLDRAGALAPGSTAIDLVRARVLFDTGDLQGAVDATSRVLGRDSGQVDALIVRGRARSRLGRSRDAVTDLTRALDARPQPDLYIERARATLGSGRVAIDAALSGLDEGIVRLGPIVTLELEALDLELRLERYDSALLRLDRDSAQAQRKESWRVRRAGILEKAGRPGEAREAYLAALAAAEALPAPVQRTPALSALIDRLHTDLERLRIQPRGQTLQR